MEARQAWRICPRQILQRTSRQTESEEMTYSIYIDESFFTTIQADSQTMADLEARLMASERGIDHFRVIAEQDRFINANQS